MSLDAQDELEILTPTMSLLAEDVLDLSAQVG